MVKAHRNVPDPVSAPVSVRRTRVGAVVIGDEEIILSFSTEGDLHICQDNDMILIPANALYKFKRAIADAEYDA